MAATPEVIERIQKLLALAGNNPNEHEAASAAAKAQSLMQEHQLEMSEVEDLKVDARTTGITEQERFVLRKAGKPGGWKVALFETVARTSDCYVFTSDYRGYDATGRMIGRADDVELAMYLFEYLVHELERLQDVYGKERWAELRAYAKQWGMSTHEAERDYSAQGNHPLRSKQSWIKGALQSVIANLTEAKAERDARNAATSALVVHKKANIDDFLARKRGYKDYADQQAQYAQRAAAWRAEHPYGVEEKRKSPSRLRREADAAERRNQRYWDREARREHREYLNTDWAAFERGKADGRDIKARPGVRGGATPDDAKLID